MLTYRHENITYHSDIDIRFHINDYYRTYTAPHWHNSLEILYILEGKEEWCLGENHHHIIESGDFLVINSREIHSMQMQDSAREMLIQIPYPFLKRYIPDMDQIRFNFSGLSQSPQKQEEYQHIREYLHTISELYPLQSSIYVLRFHSLIFELLFHFLNFFREEISPTEKESTVKYMQRLGHITSYVKEHYAEDITLNQIANEVSLNPDYFTRFFKKYMGMTFLDYVNSIRLERIARDVLETDLSVQELLELHGFTNYKLFMKMYKAQFNCTPGEMRKSENRRYP